MSFFGLVIPFSLGHFLFNKKNVNFIYLNIINLLIINIAAIILIKMLTQLLQIFLLY